MDIATVVGGILSIVVVLVSILLGGSLDAFINAPGIAVVFGGTLCAAMVAESLPAFLGAVKVGMKAVFNKAPVPGETITTIVKLSTVARREGLIALENEKIEDSFLNRGVRLAVDGMQPDDIRQTLTDELASMKARHKRGQQLFKFLAATAPSMGMIGTLIGLVQMLQQLDSPEAIGPAMAVALLTTLYGAILAFMVFGPVAEKLSHRTEEESTNMTIVIEGMEGIVKGENARMIHQKLVGFLSPKIRADVKEA